MDEQTRALRDYRRDVIDDIASLSPGMSGTQLVRAILDRLDEGLFMVEVELIVGQPVVLEISEVDAQWIVFAIDEARERRHADDDIDTSLKQVSHELQRIIDARVLHSVRNK